ncbi:MAG: hypothetical protein V4622_04150 [Bacteroidota bacterium]
MKQINYLLLFVFFSASFYLISQSLTFNAKTGDTVLDEKLKALNAEAITNISEFRSHIAMEFQTSETKITELLEIMEPAEILFAYQIAAVNSTSIDKIVTKYKQNKNEGWAVIIQKLGISQQSEKFKDLKNLSIYGKSAIYVNELSQNK